MFLLSLRSSRPALLIASPENSVGLGVMDGLEVLHLLGLRAVRSVIGQSPRLVPSEDMSGDTAVDETRKESPVEGGVAVPDLPAMNEAKRGARSEATRRRSLVIRLASILLSLRSSPLPSLPSFAPRPILPKLVVDPALLHRRLVLHNHLGLLLRVDLVGLCHYVVVVGGEDGVQGLGGNHAGLEGGVASLDLDTVEESSTASNKSASREGELRNGVEAPFVEDPGAVRDALAALEVLPHVGVVLPALELAVGVKVWVLVVESNHETNEDLVGSHVVEEGASERLIESTVLERPAEGVLDVTRLGVLLRNFPDLLHSEAKRLGLNAVPKVELLHELLAATSPGALGKEGLPGVEFHAPLKGTLGLR